jgi:hypothetical protein
MTSLWIAAVVFVMDNVHFEPPQQPPLQGGVLVQRRRAMAFACRLGALSAGPETSAQPVPF